MNLDIKRLDHHGRGISYINDKVIFIDDALPDENVDVKINREHSKYLEGSVLTYNKLSDKRVKSKCPFYKECGGCQLRHMSYEDTILFKENKIREILKKYANLETDIEVIKSKKTDNYRNKVEIHVKDGVYGFYKKRSHEIVNIDNCLNLEDSINNFLGDIDYLGVKNGIITIKCNYNGELIIIIESSEKPEIKIEKIREKYKLVGIIHNREVLYGTSHFIEIIDNCLFKESFDSFFQVNRDMNAELFNIISENINSDDVVLDVCSGVGTLGITASKFAKRVYAVEIVENAVRDSVINAKMNKRDNIRFILGDAFKTISKIKERINTFIIDPPRSGLTKDGIINILNKLPNKIIYISCDPITLSRDLRALLNNYKVDKYYILDMFPFTYHVESVCILNIKKPL